MDRLSANQFQDIPQPGDDLTNFNDSVAPIIPRRNALRPSYQRAINELRQQPRSLIQLENAPETNKKPTPALELPEGRSFERSAGGKRRRKSKRTKTRKSRRTRRKRRRRY